MPWCYCCCLEMIHDAIFDLGRDAGKVTNQVSVKSRPLAVLCGDRTECSAKA